VVHYEANGLMDIESRKPMGKDTLFHLTSSTKPITAVAVLILLGEGKLKLTDPVSKYIPEFKNPKVLVESASLPEPMAQSRFHSMEIWGLGNGNLRVSECHFRFWNNFVKTQPKV
jgi:Beta-lactamase